MREKKKKKKKKTAKNGMKEWSYTGRKTKENIKCNERNRRQRIIIIIIIIIKTIHRKGKREYKMK